MKYDVIFYLAKKTALCEKRLNKIFAQRNYEINTVTAATTPESLGMQIVDDMNCVNFLIIVGGLRDNDVRGITNVFSKALANSSKDIIPRKIRNELGDFDGYILRSGKQTIICVPDDPQELEGMLSEVVLSYLDNVYMDREKQPADM